MKSKRWYVIGLMLILSLLVVSCGGTEETAAPEPEDTTAQDSTDAVDEAMEEMDMDYPEIDPIRIALVMPSTTTDLAWSQSIYDSLVILQDHYGEENFEIAFTENMFNVTDAAAAIRDYAADGYNLVIAHGAQYGTSLFEIAPDFPETSFAWGTTTNTGADEGVTSRRAGWLRQRCRCRLPHRSKYHWAGWPG